MRPPPAGAELPPGAHSLAQDDGYVQSGFRVASDRNARVAGRRVGGLSAEAPAPEGAAPLLANRLWPARRVTACPSREGLQSGACPGPGAATGRPRAPSASPAAPA